MTKPVCSRCKVELHGNAETMPHLCADIRKRRDRQEKLVGKVEAILLDRAYNIDPDEDVADGIRVTAEAIVQALSGMLDG